jgi:hypothetical protein
MHKKPTFIKYMNSFSFFPIASWFDSVTTKKDSNQGIILCIEYWSVCPFVGIGSPRLPPPKASVSPPWIQTGEGEQHSLAGEGVGPWGNPIPTKGQTLWYYICDY